MGHRNEPARSRRRQVLTQQFSLSPIPLVEPQQQQYELENHFGWKVMQKCKIGDGSFPPHLLHCMYSDKPAMQGGDNDDVTYVLYIRGRDGDLEPVEVKETQTSSATIIVPQISAPVGALPPTEPKHKRDRSLSPKRRLISDFYYIPLKGRTIEIYDQRKSKTPDSVGDVAGEHKTKKNKPDKRKGRSTPKSWQLRAGAEYPTENSCMLNMGDNNDISESDSEIEDENEEAPYSLVDNMKKYDCSNCFNRSSPDVELLDSRFGNNRYLYMPRERYEKRPSKINERYTEQ